MAKNKNPLRSAFHRLVDKQELVGAEIGVAGGANAKAILNNLDIKRLYLIDQYLPYRGIKHHGVWAAENNPQKIKDDAIKNLEPYGDKVIWIFKLSEYAHEDINEELDFVYIDANHRYEYVKKDIELYMPKIKNDGIIGGHDFSHEGGVTKAVKELFGNDFMYSGWDWWKVIKK